MFEPGTGQSLEIPVPFSAFHDDELVNFGEEALARTFFLRWIQQTSPVLPLSLDQCVGYLVPLFLGGEDVLENLEVVDLDVYWTILGQLRQGTRHLPVGTTIGQIVRID